MSFHLYRHFDADGALLYVGQSKSAISRLNGHKCGSHWFDSIATVTIEHFDTLHEVLRAEREAIEKERPRFNRAHVSPPAAPPKKLPWLPDDLLRELNYIGQALSADHIARPTKYRRARAIARLVTAIERL